MTRYSAIGLALAALLLGLAPRADSGESGSSSASTRNGSTLPLTHAVARSLGHFPTVRGARETLAAARAAAGERRGSLFPSLDLEATATQFEEPMLVYPIHSVGAGAFPPFDETLFFAGVSAGYTLFDGGTRRGAYREARYREDAALAEAGRAERVLIAEVASKYLEIVARAQVLEAQRRRLRALESELDRATLSLTAGRAARVDSLRAQASVSAARAEEVTLAAGLALAERELSQLTGIERDSVEAAWLRPVVLVDETLAPADTLVRAALARNPEITAAAAELAAANAGADAARGARLPRLRVVGAYQYWADPEGHSSGEWRAGVTLNQTLISGGEVSNRISRRNAEASRAGEDLRLARIRVGRQVQEARDRALAASARRTSLIAGVAQFEEVVRIEALSLESGAGTQTDYLSAEADLFRARAALAEAERSVVLAHVDLVLLTSELDPEWVAVHLEEVP